MNSYIFWWYYNSLFSILYNKKIIKISELASISEDQIPEGVENADDKKACDLASCIPSTVEEVANLPDFGSLVSEDEDPTVNTEKKG